MKKSVMLMVTALTGLWGVNVSADIVIYPPPEVPANLRSRDMKDLTAARVPVYAEFVATQRKIKEQKEHCQSVEKGSAEATNCISEGNQVQKAANVYREHRQAFKKKLAIAKKQKRITDAMVALAKRLGWDGKKVDRLSTALNQLGDDGNNNVTLREVGDTWQAIVTRGENEELTREASAGGSPGLPPAGRQSFNDCAIFALANATGQPYGVIAARANELIAEGGWRTNKERSDSQGTIKRVGLNGGEVVMMAEALGQAQVVPSAAFAATIKAGRPVMVGTAVLMADGKQAGHEVVLTRTFQHGGETWYEMIDSSPKGRFYLSHTELNTLLLENGVAFHPEEKTVPQLLRSSSPPPSSPLPSP